MESRKRFDAKKHFIRIGVAALTMAASLVLTGCGRQTARAEERQLRLQRLSEAGAIQIASALARLEDNQIKLQRLSETYAEQVAIALARLEKNQDKLHLALANVQAGANRGVTNVVAAQQEQMKLQEILRQDTRQLSNNIAAVGQDQHSLQGQIALAQSNIQKVDGTERADPLVHVQRWKRQPGGAWQLQKVRAK